MTTIVFHVQPRAKQTELVGWHGDAIKVRLKAPPVDGAANEELVRFVTERLGVSRSAVRIVSSTINDGLGHLLSFTHHISWGPDVITITSRLRRSFAARSSLQ